MKLPKGYEDPYNPDELSDDERQDMAAFAGATDVEICQAADLGDPAADEIFSSWSTERRRAAARAADAQRDAG